MLTSIILITSFHFLKEYELFTGLTPVQVTFIGLLLEIAIPEPFATNAAFMLKQ